YPVTCQPFVQVMFGGSSAALGVATSAKLAAASRGEASVRAAFRADFALARDRRAPPMSDADFFVVFPLATAFLDAFFFEPPLVDFLVLARRVDFIAPLRNYRALIAYEHDQGARLRSARQCQRDNRGHRVRWFDARR